MKNKITSPLSLLSYFFPSFPEQFSGGKLKFFIYSITHIDIVSLVLKKDMHLDILREWLLGLVGSGVYSTWLITNIVMFVFSMQFSEAIYQSSVVCYSMLCAAYVFSFLSFIYFALMTVAGATIKRLQKS